MTICDLQTKEIGTKKLEVRDRIEFVTIEGFSRPGWGPAFPFD